LIANELRTGMTILHEGDIYEITDYMHTQPGKGGALVKAKLRNLRTGVFIDYTFRANQKVEQAIIERKKMEYLYRDGEQFYFMDPQTYENIPVARDKVENCLDFLKENEICTFITHGNEIIEVKGPDFVVLEIISTEPGARGDTVSGGSKPITLETGVIIQGPLFLNTGEKVKVDTRTRTYIQRA